MCGIYGFRVVPRNQLTEYESTILSLTLAREMEGRGRDSFGGVQFPAADVEEGKVDVVKGLGRVSEQGTKILRMASHSTAFLGHTRAASRGSVSLENAHPFRIGDVLGVHNGAISNHEELNKKYDRKFEVDSMHAFAHIDQGRDIEELVGWGTFFWSRCSEHWKRIYFAHSLGGSLSIGRMYRDEKAPLDADNPVLVAWASEGTALQKAAHLLGFAYHPLKIEHSEIYVLDSEARVFNTGNLFVLSTYSKREEAEVTNPYCWNQDEDDDSFFKDRFSHVVGPDKGKTDHQRNTKVTRAQRKAIRKRIKNAKKSNETWREDPLPANIQSGYGHERVYLPVDGKGGRAEAHFLCPDCECVLDGHIWGWCMNNGGSTTACKANHNSFCDVPVPVCSDCGHYLIQGIHEQTRYTMYDLVECKICGNFCAPESTILDVDGPEPKDEEEEGTGDTPPDTKPTTLVLVKKEEDQKEEPKKIVL